MPSDGSSISFPDVPRAALDQTIEELLHRARDVLSTQGRLRALLRANQNVIGQIELSAVLRGIVEAAVDLVGAQYGALGVIAPEGGLEQFIHTGVSAQQAERIGHLPEGHGLLGALIEDPRPISLQHLADDPRSVGFPAHHPEMDSFLGVPVRVGGEVFGNLYLTNQAAGVFSEEDVELITSLAATAGSAINNARLYEQIRRRQERTDVAAALVTEILSSHARDPLALVAERIRQVGHARGVQLLRPTQDGTEFHVTVVDTTPAQLEAGPSLRAAGTVLGEIAATGIAELLDGDAARLEDLTPQKRTGAFICVPLSAGETLEALVVAEREVGSRFTRLDLELAADLGRQAAVALQLAAARADQERMELFEDRARIARDLHDLVIQQIFGAGLELQSVVGSLGDRPEAARIVSSVDVLDAAIAQIRTIIFALSAKPDGARSSVRHRVLDVASETGALLPRSPIVSFSGPIDLTVSEVLADDLVAVVREALTNIAKHARARSASVSVAVVRGEVVVDIVDDGVGLGDSTRRSGLANLETRATKHGGRLEVDSDSTGTRLRWVVLANSETDD